MIETRFEFPDRFAHAEHPFVATIVVNETCNEKCGHCWYTTPWSKDPPRAELENRMRVLRRRGARFLALTGGEPSLRRDLEDLVAFGAGEGLRMGLLTNGTKIDAKRAEALVAAGLRTVSLTLFSADASEHEAITILEGSFAKTLAAARAFRSREIPTNIRTPVMKPNRGAVPGLASLCARESFLFEPYFDIDPPRGSVIAPWALAPEEADEILAAHTEVFAPTFRRFGFAEAVVDAEGLFHAGQCPVNPIGRVSSVDGTGLPL